MADMEPPPTDNEWLETEPVRDGPSVALILGVGMFAITGLLLLGLVLLVRG